MNSTFKNQFTSFGMCEIFNIAAKNGLRFMANYFGLISRKTICSFSLYFMIAVFAEVLSTHALAYDGTEELVQKYAPILMHPYDEHNLPGNIISFLEHSKLMFWSSDCPQDIKEFGQASEALLESATLTSSCDGHIFKASGTRSATRSHTFILTDVSPDDAKAGSKNPHDWDTYFHRYRNIFGGWTIQYWSFYPYNTGLKFGPFTFGSHGGDWEMVEVVLDTNNQPTEVRMTGHQHIQSVPWQQVQLRGTHPVFYTERGAHEAHTKPVTPEPWIKHPTWDGESTSVPGGHVESVGQLIDLGTRLDPKVEFLRYSGLWGSLGATPFSSGYWGPAYNETDMPPNGFLAVWCDQIDDPNENRGLQRECFPDDQQ